MLEFQILAVIGVAVLIGSGFRAVLFKLDRNCRWLTFIRNRQEAIVQHNDGLLRVQISQGELLTHLASGQHGMHSENVLGEPVLNELSPGDPYAGLYAAASAIEHEAADPEQPGVVCLVDGCNCPTSRGNWLCEMCFEIAPTRLTDPYLRSKTLEEQQQTFEAVAEYVEAARANYESN